MTGINRVLLQRAQEAEQRVDELRTLCLTNPELFASAWARRRVLDILGPPPFPGGSMYR